MKTRRLYAPVLCMSCNACCLLSCHLSACTVVNMSFHKDWQNVYEWHRWPCCKPMERESIMLHIKFEEPGVTLKEMLQKIESKDSWAIGVTGSPCSGSLWVKSRGICWNSVSNVPHISIKCTLSHLQILPLLQHTHL